MAISEVLGFAAAEARIAGDYGIATFRAARDELSRLRARDATLAKIERVLSLGGNIAPPSAQHRIYTVSFFSSVEPCFFDGGTLEEALDAALRARGEG